MTETVIVLVVSALGSLFSLALLADAIVDYRLAKRLGEDDLAGVAIQHIVSEAIRLGVLLIFLGLAVTVVLTDRLPPGILVWSLVAVVLLATSSSVYAWVWRRVQFQDLKREAT